MLSDIEIPPESAIVTENVSCSSQYKSSQNFYGDNTKQD